MKGSIQQTQHVPVRLWIYARFLLSGLAALALVLLFYHTVSRRVVRLTHTRPSPASVDQTPKPVQSGESPAENRQQDLSHAEKTGNLFDPEDETKEETSAQVQERVLLDEPRPTVQPRVEALLGNSALVNGQWLPRGGKTGEFTLVDIGVDKVTMTDREGRHHDFGLSSAESSRVPTWSDSAARETSTESAQSFDVPDAILDAIKQLAPDARLKKVNWVSARGHYAVETVTEDGRDIDMKIAPDGTLRVKDEEVHLADLPPSVLWVVQEKLANGGILSDLKRWTRDGEISYEAEIKTGSQKVDLELREDGTSLDRR